MLSKLMDNIYIDIASMCKYCHLFSKSMFGLFWRMMCGVRCDESDLILWLANDAFNQRLNLMSMAIIRNAFNSFLTGNCERARANILPFAQ